MKPLPGRARSWRPSPERKSWWNILQRCGNPRNPKYALYGARGISVCEKWKSSFEAFLADVGPRPEPKSAYSIDRIDNDGDYKPGNCRWATREEQNRNKRNNRLLTIGAETRTVAEWAQSGPVDAATILYRSRNGWDPARAVTEAAQPGGPKPDRVPLEPLERVVRSGRVWASGRQMTHCSRGHEFTTENTYLRHRDGLTERFCRACARARDRRRTRRGTHHGLAQQASNEGHSP